MSQENVDIIRRIFGGWATGDLTAGAAELDQYVAFIVRSPFPEPAAVLGRDAVAEYMATFIRGWKRYAIEAKDMRAIGDTVLVDAIQRAEGRASGVEVETRYFMLFTFRASRIVRIESLLDEKEALEAVGLSE